MKQFITLLVASLLIVGLIAFGFSILLANLIGFWSSFIGLFILLWGAAFFYKDWDIRRTKHAELVYQAKRDYIDERNIAQIECPCGKTVISKELFVNDLGGDNEYSCTACHSTYKVEITADPVLITNPVNIDTKSIQLFDKLKAATPDGSAGAVTL
jgi:hypothetical protein